METQKAVADDIEEKIGGLIKADPELVAKLLYPEMQDWKDTRIRETISKKSPRDVHRTAVKIYEEKLASDDSEDLAQADTIAKNFLSVDSALKVQDKARKIYEEKMGSGDLDSLVGSYKLAKRFLGDVEVSESAQKAFSLGVEKVKETQDPHDKFKIIEKVFEVDFSDTEYNEDDIKLLLHDGYHYLSGTKGLKYQELYGAVKDLTRDQQILPKVYEVYSFMNTYIRQVVQKMDLPYRYAQPKLIRRDINNALRYFALGFMENAPKRDDDLWTVVQNAKLRLSSLA